MGKRLIRTKVQGGYCYSQKKVHNGLRMSSLSTSILGLVLRETFLIIRNKVRGLRTKSHERVKQGEEQQK